MVCGYWYIPLITCLSLVFVGAVVVSDVLPQPENLTLSWSPDYFSVITQWNKPAGLDADCKVLYEIELFLEKCPPRIQAFQSRRLMGLSYTFETDANEVCFKISTLCGNRNQSKTLFKGLSRPQGAVENFSCVYYSDKKMNCTWNLISSLPDLQLFYGFQEESLKPCDFYITDGILKTGCHLHDVVLHKKYFFYFNGTHKESPFQNVFIREPKDSVKTLPPRLNITKEGKNLCFETSAPFNSRCWNFNFYYRKCDEEEKKFPYIKNETYKVEYDESCNYTARVQAVYITECGKEYSVMSEYVHYGMKRDPDWSLKVAMIVTPIIVSCCFIVALVLCRRHKDYICPTIPEPHLLFKDVLNSNKDKSLYVPYEEVVEKRISLEPESTFLHSEP